MEMYQNLPLEVLHKVLEYDGKIVHRRGKYIDRISSDDRRYRLLRKIPKPIFVCMDRTIPLVILRDRKHGNTHYILIKKPIAIENYREDGFLITNNIRHDTINNVRPLHNGILYMMEKYASSYDKIYEIRRIFS